MNLTEFFDDLILETFGKLKPYTYERLVYLRDASKEPKSIFNQHHIRLAWKEVMPQLKRHGAFDKYEGNKEMREKLKEFLR